MSRTARSLSGRVLASLCAALALGFGACLPRPTLRPEPGLRAGHARNLVAVPGGLVDTAGANLIVRRVDLSIDTLLGHFEIGAVYNAASGEWRWSFQIRYDGARFLDPTGAAYDLGGDPPPGGLTIPGTPWVRLDASTIRTKGGLAHHFAPDGSLAAISWATLEHPRLRFSAGEIAQCSAPGVCAPIAWLDLDAAGRPLAITGARSGRLAEFAYDSLGRLVVARSPVDVERGAPGFRYEYAGVGTLLAAQTNSEGERVEYAYQGERRLLDVRQIGEGDPVHRFELLGKDPATGLFDTVHVNPLGGRTRYRYDAARHLLAIVREATAEVTTLAWDPGRERPAAITPPHGGTTRFEVDANDDVVRVEQPSGNVLLYEYAPEAIDPDQPLARPSRRIEDALGLVAALEHDASGRLARLETAEGEVFETEYAGLVRSSLRLPFGEPVSFDAYGVHGHWIEAHAPSSDFPLRRAIDPVGNVQVPAAGLQEGGVLWREFDAARRVAAIEVAATDADGHVTSQDSVTIERRSDGRPTAVRRPGGGDHEFVHDALGRVVLVRERVDGVWQDTAFEHDAAGNLTARHRPNGMRDEFGYDAYGRLVRREALRGGVSEGVAEIGWANGLPATYTDSTRGTTELYAYDAAGRLATVHWSSGEWLALAYDVRSRVVERAYHLPGGPSRSVGLEYDGANRQTRIVLDGVETLLEIEYAGARETTVRHGNGLVRRADYDPETGQLLGFTTTDAAGDVVEETTIERRVEALEAHYAVTTATTTTLAATSETYRSGLAGSLSRLDELVGSRVFGWNDAGGATRSYAYDGLGNAVSNAAGDTYTYNAEGNRLVEAQVDGETIAYAYDAAGFATARGGVPLTWTATGRIASFGPVQLEWDLANRPISMEAGPWRRDFVLFGGAVSSDPDTGAVGSLDLGPVRVPFAGSERLYRHFDFRHNVSFVSDETGSIVSHYEYGPYGVEQVHGAGIDTRRFVAGSEIGDGLVLLGLRVHDSRVGRFLSPDPVFQLRSAYAYAYGNPIEYVDPDGAHPAPSGDPSSAAPDVVDAASQLVQATAGLAAAFVFAAQAPGPASIAVLIAATLFFERSLRNYLDAKAAAEGGEPPPSSADPGPPPPRQGAGDAPDARGVRPIGIGGGGSMAQNFTGIGYGGLFRSGGVAPPPSCEGAPSALAGAPFTARWYFLMTLALLQGLLAIHLRRRRRTAWRSG